MEYTYNKNRKIKIIKRAGDKMMGPQREVGPTM